MRKMMYIKLDENMNLGITVNEPIYRGDHLSRKIIFLVPVTVGAIDTERAAVYLSYIRADGTADVALLKRTEEKYKEKYWQYVLPVTTTLSRYPGEVCMWLQIYSGPAYAPSIAKSGECVLNIQASTNMDEYISDRNLSLIYQMQRQMEDKVEKAEEDLNTRIDETNEAMKASLEGKADGIVFNEEDSTIQLYATIVTANEETGEEHEERLLLGEPIFVRTDRTGSVIVNVEINDAGELIATMEGGEQKNLGRVVGMDGKVYVPHVDERKVLTFTLEDEPGPIPPAADLNPMDEWSGIDDGEVVSDYIWESL